MQVFVSLCVRGNEIVTLAEKKLPTFLPNELTNTEFYCL